MGLCVRTFTFPLLPRYTVWASAEVDGRRWATSPGAAAADSGVAVGVRGSLVIQPRGGQTLYVLLGCSLAFLEAKRSGMQSALALRHWSSSAHYSDCFEVGFSLVTHYVSLRITSGASSSSIICFVRSFSRAHVELHNIQPWPVLARTALSLLLTAVLVVRLASRCMRVTRLGSFRQETVEAIGEIRSVSACWCTCVLISERAENERPRPIQRTEEASICLRHVAIHAWGRGSVGGDRWVQEAMQWRDELVVAAFVRGQRGLQTVVRSN